jgi:hypothetical protein
MKRLAAICSALLMLNCMVFAKIPDNPDKESLLALRQAVFSPSFWVKVHAIEFLADLGYLPEATQYTDGQLASFDSIPQKRIGFWRCKYRLSRTENERKIWLEKIKDAYSNTGGADRIHAAETLAKLGFSLRHFDDSTVEKDLKSESDLAAFALWGYVLPKYENDATDFDRLFAMFGHQNAGFRKIAAYSLGFIPGIPEEKWFVLAEKALQEPAHSPAYPYMLSAAYIVSRSGSSKDLVKKIRQKLTGLKDVQDKSARIELCRALAAKGAKTDLPLLKDLLHLTNPLRPAPDTLSQSDADVANEDVRAAAAYAVLCLQKKYK